MIYEQCAQIVRSYGPPCDESMRAGLLVAIEHFKGLYERKLSVGATADKPALGVSGSLPSGESDPLVTTDSTGAGSVAQTPFTPELMNQTTVSCSGKEITIQCNNHEVKDALMDILIDGAYALSSTPAQAPLDRERIAKAICSALGGYWWQCMYPKDNEKWFKAADAVLSLSSTYPQCTCAAIVNPNIPHARFCPLSSTDHKS